MPPAGSGAGGEGWDTKGHKESRKPDQGVAEGVAAPRVVSPNPRILGGPARPNCTWVLLICVSWSCLHLLSAFCLSALDLRVCLAQGGKQQGASWEEGSLRLSLLGVFVGTSMLVETGANTQGDAIPLCPPPELLCFPW